MLTPKPVALDELAAGEVGFVVANIKRISESRIGDTITDDARPAAGPCRASKISNPWSSRASTR